MRIYPDELTVVGSLSPAAQASFVAFRDTLTHNRQIREFVKDSSVNFYVGHGRNQVFVCFIHCRETEADVWLHRRGKLADRVDLDQAVISVLQEANGHLRGVKTKTWYRVRFNLAEEPAVLTAQLILKHVAGPLT